MSFSIGLTFSYKLRLVLESAMISPFGSGLSHDQPHSLPADILVFDREHGKPAALDLTIASPLNSNILQEVGVASGQQLRLLRHGSMQPMTRIWDGLVYLLLLNPMVFGAKKPMQECFHVLSHVLSTLQAANPRPHHV